jgi:OmpA-OmpF porin, OOP family
MKSVRSYKIAASLAFIALLMYASAACAENKAGAFTVSPYFGMYMFDEDSNYDDNTMWGLALGYNLTKWVSLEGSYSRVDTYYHNGLDKIDGTLNLYRIEALYNFMPDSMFVPFLAVGGGLYSQDTEKNGPRLDNDGAVDYGAGFKLFLIPNVALRADIRHILNTDASDWKFESNWFYTGGLCILFGGGEKAAPATVQEAAPAAAAAPAPAVIEEPRDSDNDGVADDLDKCPGTPAGVKVDMDGCPVDSDKDGVPDYLDKCPGTPAGVKVDNDGCPVDSDNDGVADYLDKCPNTPAGTKVDAQGCPLAEGAQVTSSGAYNFGIIYFDTSKATIKPESRPVLQKVLNYLEMNKDVKLEIQGYTDSVGSDDLNQKLSDARAKSVRKYLVDKGIAADRLTAKGFGESNPADTNKTREGRAKNRRIEFMPIQ